ncbi:hypothetical protein [Marinobacter sp. ATCH36]|uniref:hypothetical protein n=1 Tax=Marinobacter sp. ATCH36 TaxID=2945106 RepID=UPI002020A7DB|nr:hypothetical protein [Marinobacter sp. ATCH36]MCL7945160.1 hypothetical protein [Marinobacter sp. ATCH36]
MNFKITGPIRQPETFAQGSGIRELKRLKRVYGDAHWRKRKGNATICLDSGVILEAEIHWYEASGIGKREFKIKQILE